MPARRRRRSHRRDVERSREYTPVPIQPGMARDGVRSRLWSACIAVGVTFICIVGLVLWPQTSFATAALFSVGFCAFNAAIALILSARREESVHELAHEFQTHRSLPEAHPPMLPSLRNEAQNALERPPELICASVATPVGSADGTL